MSSPHEPTSRLFLRWLADGLFIPLAFLYALAGAAFGCSGSVSIGGGTNNPDPNRALGTYEVQGTVAESASTVFFGYWIDGDSGIQPAEGEVLQQAVGPVRTRATITIVPSSILYQETATELSTGRTMTVSISGTWSYDATARLRADWGAAVVTASTFPAPPPFDLATVGTQIQANQLGDIVFADSAWNQLTNVVAGPLDAVFFRVN